MAAVLVPTFLRLHILSPELWRSGAVYASLPLPMELARLPMSVFFPTPYLPMWASCLQLLVVVGLGELILGRWLTVMVAIAGHFGSTLLARVLLDSTHAHVFGLTPALAHVLDTGPSAATTAIGACLLVGARMNRCAVLLAVSLLVAAFFVRGVDGAEHSVALGCGVFAGFAFRVVTRPEPFRQPSWMALWSRRPTWMRRFFRLPRLAVQALRSRGF
jgi:hypothetical protein